LNRRFTKSIEAPAARAQAEVGRVSSIAHESLDGVLVVKTLGRQDQEVARFAEAAAALREERIAVGRLRANYSPIIYSLPNLGILVLLLVGTWLFSQGTVTLGEMVRAMALFSILSLPMEILGFLFQMIPQSVVAQDRINEVLAVAPESTVVGGVVGSATVDFVDLSFAYPTEGSQAPLVLEGLSLHIDPGETVALVGSTGAGKSTLVALLAALMPPTEGRVLLGGVDVQDLGSEGTAAVVAPVFQETFLFADSVRQNLTLGRDIPEGELQRVLTLVEAEGFVSEMPQGIDTVVGERGVTLSGGQRQRLAIARGLLRRPKVLVLDDATSAVDPTIEAAILANLRAHGDRTLLVVAHRLATIRLADRVLFLESGRIAAQGTHEELLAVSAYAALAQAYEKAGS
ncbi:MAG: ABC transporter ATP-binding protein, partial [Acidimicrobiales bacterium]